MAKSHIHLVDTAPAAIALVEPDPQPVNQARERFQLEATYLRWRMMESKQLLARIGAVLDSFNRIR
jgi:hypothetical protein